MQWSRKHEMRTKGASVGTKYWIFTDPHGKKWYSKKQAVANGMPEDESLWKDDVAEVPHDKSDPPSQIVPAEAGPGHPKEQPKPVIDEPSEEDGDISTPSSAVAVACKSPVKAESPVGKSLKTPTPKRSLKDQAELKTPVKRAKVELSNSKRQACEVCQQPRTEGQRGAACELRLAVLRKHSGHQSLQKCKADASLFEIVAQQSQELRKNQSAKPVPAKRPERRSWKSRVSRCESMLLALMNHFDLELQ